MSLSRSPNSHTQFAAVCVLVVQSSSQSLDTITVLQVLYTADSLWIRVCTVCKEGLCSLSVLCCSPVQVVCVR